MNNKCFLVVCVSLISLSFAINAYALDALTKVQLRTSYKQFEKCMQDAQNDITECLKEFNRAVDVYKNALKQEPQNDNIKQKLLTLVNALYDIAETYYSAAESKKGVDPGLSKTYYLKAALCYDQLIKLYPDKVEFSDLSKQATYLAGYEEVEVYVLEFKNRKRLDYALLTLHKLKSSRDSFISRFGQSKDLDKILDEVVGQFADNVSQQFKTTLEDQDPDSMQTLINLIDAQAQIINVDSKEKYKTTLAHMEAEIVRTINDLVKSYYSALEKSNIYYKKGDYVQAEAGFNSLSTRTESFPSYSFSNTALEARIRHQTNNFNIRKFQAKIHRKAQMAKDTVDFLSIIEKGKAAFTNEVWIVSLNAFREAIDLAKDNELPVNKNIPSEWLIKVEKKIDNLDENEIVTSELAELRYEPITYSEWLQLARKGEFSKKYVSVSGKFQQKVGEVVILKDDTLEYDLFLETVFMSEKMNTAGLILKQKRLLREGDYISCIGKFDDIEKFETVLGAEFQLPVFRVVWIPK